MKLPSVPPVSVEFKVKKEEKENSVEPEAIEKAIKKGRKAKKQKRKVKKEDEPGEVEIVPEQPEIVHHEVVKNEDRKEDKQSATEKAQKRTFWFYP